MTKLEYVRLELDNHIAGLKISKSTGYWTEDDERILNLMLMIKDILDSVTEVEAKELNRCDTCRHEKSQWFNRCADCSDYELWEGKTNDQD